MRVYQFRHIRAGRDIRSAVPSARSLDARTSCSGELWPALAALLAARRDGRSARRATRRLATSRSSSRSTRRRSRRRRPQSRVLTMRGADAHASTCARPTSAATSREPRRGAAHARRAASSARFPAASVRWRYSIVAERARGRRPAAELGRLARLPGVARVYPTVRYHARRSSRRTRQLDRRHRALGAGPDHRGQRDEDRDHRRRRRPDASVLLARRLHDAGRASRRAIRTSRPQGHRRARVRARVAEHWNTRTCRSIPSSVRARDARRRDRRRRPRHDREPADAAASRASRRRRTSATTRC